MTERETGVPAPPTLACREERLTRIAILISGSGSNMAAIADHLQDVDGIDVGIVISDRKGAGGLDKAAIRGIPTRVVDWESFEDRPGFTSAVCAAIEEAGCVLVVLAGFMRILSPEAVRRFPDRIVNIHPSLLPSFPGAHAVEDALAHGVEWTGVTIHIVDELVDHGPILRQEPVRIEPGDTVVSLHARIQAVEHRIYPETVVAFARQLP